MSRFFFLLRIRSLVQSTVPWLIRCSFWLSAVNLQAHIVITASEFNRIYNCDNPYLMTQATTLILDQDIIIDGTCNLFTTAPSITPSQTLILSSTTGNSLIVSSHAFWNIMVPLEFKGNASLKIGAGATLNFNDVEIIFSDDTLLIPSGDEVSA